MDKKTRYAVLSPIKKGIVFSDPCFDDVVYWQYRKEFQSTGWLMKLETTVDTNNVIDLRLSIGRKTLMAGIQFEKDGSGREFTTYPGNYRFDEVEIETDRPKVFVGTMENFLLQGEDGAIYTGASGLFGDLYVFTNRGEQTPAGFLLLASVDGAVINQDEFFDTIRSSFDAVEIEKEAYEAAIDQNTISFKLARLEELKTAQTASKEQLQARDREAYSD